MAATPPPPIAIVATRALATPGASSLVTAEMPGHWRAFQRSPTPRPTGSVPRRVDSPHRTHQPFGLREDGARAPPWRHARRLAAHKVTRLLRSQRQNPKSRTDSCQPHPLSRHARATRSLAIRYTVCLCARRSGVCPNPVSGLSNSLNEPFTAVLRLRFEDEHAPSLLTSRRTSDEALPAPLRASLSIAQICESADP